MSIASAESSIFACKMQIMEYEDRIRILRRDIKRLENLYEQYGNISKEFYEINMDSLRKVKEMNCTNAILKSVTSYTSHMHNFMTGHQFNDALDGIADARKVVAKKICDMDEEIQVLTRQIDNCCMKIQQLHVEIQEIKEREAMENV